MPPAVAELLKLVQASLDDDKAEDVVVIDLAGKTEIADFMVIANGISKRQVGAMADHLQRKRFPRHRFVWIMGADNLIDISRWNDWTTIFETVPVAVFARPAYSFRALVSNAAKRFARHQLNESRAAALVDTKLPAWVFLHIRLSTVSATRIRGGTRSGR